MTMDSSVRTGRLTTTVPANAAVVRERLGDLRNLPGLHPLVVAVEYGPVIGGRQQYTITDRIALGGLRVTSRYTVVIGPTPDGQLVAQARSFPRVLVDTTYRFVPVDGGTEVIETLCTRAPLGLRDWVWRQAFQAHRTMLDNLREEFGERVL
jgi:hypothetical protein